MDENDNNDTYIFSNMWHTTPSSVKPKETFIMQLRLTDRILIFLFFVNTTKVKYIYKSYKYFLLGTESEASAKSALRLHCYWDRMHGGLLRDTFAY